VDEIKKAKKKNEIRIVMKGRGSRIGRNKGGMK
jgi:hypothetical protein